MYEFGGPGDVTDPTVWKDESCMGFAIHLI